MNIYAFQMDIAWEDKPANFGKVRQEVETLQPKPGGLIILPEMFATGFSMNAACTQETPEGPTTDFLRELARSTQCHVVGGLTRSQSNGRPTNDALLLAPDGQSVGSYSKLHPFSMGKEGDHYAAGHQVSCFTLPNGWNICPFICYDLRFPEAFRKAMQSDLTPDLFVVIANWPNKRTQHWVRLLEARAIENLAYVVGVNRCGSDPYLQYDGRSCMVDPLGQVLEDAGVSETWMHHELDLNHVREWRESFPALRDRRTDL